MMTKSYVEIDNQEIRILTISINRLSILRLGSAPSSRRSVTNADLLDSIALIKALPLDYEIHVNLIHSDTTIT
jgi:hypothetical protein